MPVQGSAAAVNLFWDHFLFNFCHAKQIGGFKICVVVENEESRNFLVRACKRVKKGLKENQILRSYANHTFRGNIFLFVVNGLSFKWHLSLLVGFLLFVIKYIHIIEVFLIQCFPIEINLLFVNRREVVHNDVIVVVTIAKAFDFNLRIGARRETRTLIWPSSFYIKIVVSGSGSLNSNI